MQGSVTQAEIAEITQATRIARATSVALRGIASPESAAPGDLSFLGNRKYKAAVASSRASVVLLPPDYVGAPGPNQIYLTVDNPSVALARLCARIERALWPRPERGIHPSA